FGSGIVSLSKLRKLTDCCTCSLRPPFSIQYTNIPKGEVCANIVKSQKAVGWDSVGTVKYNDGYKISDVSTYCGSNGSGVITLKFARDNANGSTAP
ncbi:hypothetical protein, partial [Pseudomonas helleri]|uniref:hypothetical protein n=1 Tax=Pseudomonas helleri TaxID=1608996 RepID=UPI001E644C90